MPNSQHPRNPSLIDSSPSFDDEADILNDSISLDMNHDDSFSFHGNQSTFIAPPRPGPIPSAGLTEEPEDRGRVQVGPSRDRSLPKHEQTKRRVARRHQDLENERDWLRQINRLLESSADEMDKVKLKLVNVQTAIETSHELLDLYSKILTQTEHTRELISNPDWAGLTEDTRRRVELRRQEKIRLAQQREKEREEELMRERKRREQEAEEAERVRKLNQSQRSNRPQIATNSRARGASSTAGRANRGKSRIARLNP